MLGMQILVCVIVIVSSISLIIVVIDFIRVKIWEMRDSWYEGFMEAESYLKDYGYKDFIILVNGLGQESEYGKGFRDYKDHYENTLPKMIMVEGVYVPRDIELSTKNFHTKSSTAEKNVRRKLKS
tara:strand:- start:1644 stop:2018 length:375 start_codon:yes stop_codon:yes gene_type:complete